MREAARPIDRRIVPDRWSAEDFLGVTTEQMLFDFWGSAVPGSGAWDVMFVGAVSSKGQLGYPVESMMTILDAGLNARAAGDRTTCVALGRQLLRELERLPRLPGHAATTFYGPAPLESMPVSHTASRHDPVEDLVHGSARDLAQDVRDVEARIHAGWLGQIAGGAFGTTLEGCTGEALARTYGTIDAYVGDVVTLNDDCVYELLAIDAMERSGVDFTSSELAGRWRSELPFAWSAEWVALENLRNGLGPPDSGRVGNPMHDWIGAQMRTMVYGLVCPARPRLAMELADRDSVISHAGNGVVGGRFAAALVADAFACREPRQLLGRSVARLPESEYTGVVRSALACCAAAESVSEAWSTLDRAHRYRNWIHAYPNIAAVVVALWFGDGDFTRSLSILALCGLDVDCNAGLVGTILGVQAGSVPAGWTDPLQDRIDTYLPGRATLSLSGVADRTCRLARLITA
jgi:ADP-ribosylglycohydrolase